jgi:regulator of protease activity HflC (stomatin/prohibitin superfamily)
MLKMKNWMKLGLVASMPWMMTGCYMTTIDSGEAGVEVVNGEVQDNALHEGFHFSLNPLTDIDVYNTKVKALIMNNSTAGKEDSHEIIYDTHLTILTRESMEVPLDMVLNYSLSKSCASSIRKHYGTDGVWDEKIVIPKVRSVSRGVIGTATVYDLNEKRDSYSVKIKDNLNKKFTGIFGEGCVRVSTASIQNIYIPVQLKKSIMAKQQMNEEVARKELEIKRTEAEAKQRVAKEKGEAEAKRVNAQGIADARIIEATAIAKANREISASLTPEVLAYKQLENDKAEIDRWDGVKPKVLMGTGATPIVQLPSITKEQ